MGLKLRTNMLMFQKEYTRINQSAGKASIVRVSDWKKAHPTDTDVIDCRLTPCASAAAEALQKLSKCTRSRAPKAVSCKRRLGGGSEMPRQQSVGGATASYFLLQ